MRVRSLVALVIITALTAWSGSDLLARTRGCGPHPCCVKGACKMMPKSGARLDRCGDPNPADAPHPPMLLSSTGSDGVLVSSSITERTVLALTAEGATRGVDRPPRG